MTYSKIVQILLISEGGGGFALPNDKLVLSSRRSPKICSGHSVARSRGNGRYDCSHCVMAGADSIVYYKLTSIIARSLVALY